MDHLNLLIACSGPGVQEAILGARLTAYCYLGFTVILTLFLALLTFRNPKLISHLLGSILLVALHPVFRMNPNAGDCGDGLRSTSLLWALATAFIFAWANLKVWRASIPPEN